MALTGPQYRSSTEDAPRGWTVLSTSTVYRQAMIARYLTGANQGYVDNVGAAESMAIVGTADQNGGALPAGHTLTMSPEVMALEIILPMTFTSTITTANRNQLVFGVDSNTCSLSSADGIPVGMLFEVVDATHGKVGVGPTFVARALGQSSAAALAAAQTPRGVLTNLGGTTTYANGVLTGPAATSLPTQDGGLAPAVGEIWYAPKWLANLPAAANAGPWEIQTLGGAGAWTAQRPAGYPSGSTIPTEFKVKVGPEGLVYGNSEWTSTATPGGTVDTTDPAFAFSGGSLAYAPPPVREVRGVVTANIASLSAFTVASNDGLTYTAGQTFVAVGQTTQSQNGAWVVGPVATGAAPLTRPPWWASGALAPPAFQFNVSEGTQGANSQWLVRTAGPITIDTTAVAIDMIDGNWVQGGSTAVGTMAGPSAFFFVGATLKARLSGIFAVELDVGWSDGTTADSVTFALVTDTVADGSGAVLGSANKVNHGVTGLGTYGTRGADWESCDTNAGGAITFNAAAFSTAPITQASEVNPTLTGLLTGSAQKFSFKGIVYNASPSGTTKTPFPVGNQVAFGVSVTATHTITVATVRMTVRELPAQ